MPSIAYRPDGTRIDARYEPTDRWLELYREIKSGLLLQCRTCGDTNLRPREESPSVGRHRHFFHYYPPGETERPCSDRYGEGGGESRTHQTIKETVAAAYNSLPDIKAETELWVPDISRRPDVVASRGDRFETFTEVQQSHLAAAVLWERDETHTGYLRSLGPDSSGFYASTLWLASRSYEGSRGTFPMVYTTENGDRAIRGIYAEYAKTGWTGPDLDQPLEFDIDKLLAIQLAHMLYLIGRKGDDDCVWMYRPKPGGPPPKRGKRLRRTRPEVNPLRLCRQTPIAPPIPVPAPATIPLPQPIVRFGGVEPFPTTTPKQARRGSPGRYEIGDLIRSRVTGRHGEIIEVRGQRNPIYRIINDDGIWPIAEQHAERFLGVKS